LVTQSSKPHPYLKKLRTFRTRCIINDLHHKKSEQISEQIRTKSEQNINKDTHSSRIREWLNKLLGETLGNSHATTQNNVRHEHNWFHFVWAMCLTDGG